MSTAAEHASLTDEGRLYSWRLHVIEKLGYSTSEAADLAGTDIGLHDLADLIEQGCPHDLARRILA